MSVNGSADDAGWRHDASWCPRPWTNRFRCNCRFMVRTPTYGFGSQHHARRHTSVPGPRPVDEGIAASQRARAILSLPACLAAPARLRAGPLNLVDWRTPWLSNPRTVCGDPKALVAVAVVV